jgi:hypothetical protein
MGPPFFGSVWQMVEGIQAGCLRWVMNVDFDLLAVVRFTPDSDKTADIEQGRRRGYEQTSADRDGLLGGGLWGDMG